MKIDIHGHFVDPHYLDELKRTSWRSTSSRHPTERR